MAYTVEVAPAAKRQIRKLDHETRRRVVVALEQLETEPRPRSATKLQAVEDLYRVRVGDYRIIYEVFDQRLLVLILKVGNRRDIYRSL